MNMVQAVKKCALDAVEASMPCDVVFGRVESAEPLIVSVGNIVLPNEMVVVSKNLEYRAEKIQPSVYEWEIVVNEGLKEGDVIILIRKSGGEKYIAVGKI